MTSNDDLTTRMRKLGVGTNTNSDPASPPPAEKKSFLDSLNSRLEKAPQQQRRDRRRPQGTFGKAPRPAPRNLIVPPEPSTLFVLIWNHVPVRVYKRFEAALEVAEAVGATDGRLRRWNDQGMRDWGDPLQILPKKLQTSTNKAETKDETSAGTEGEKRIPVEQVKSVYMALDRSLCLGIFTEKPAAWEACLKHMTQVTYAVKLSGEERWVGKDGLPHLEGKVGGSGTHHWHVQLFSVDRS